MIPTFETPSATASETTQRHTRLLKCTLCVEESRAYWRHRAAARDRVDPALAFEQAWFGAKSLPWVDVLVNNLRARFDAFPDALFVLARWRTMSAETRRLICHFHLQLTDPLYRQFTGEYLVGRRMGLRAEVQRHSVMRWVAEQEPGRWTVATQTQFASRLLSCALAAGFIKGRRDPRALVLPRIPDEALVYLLYLLRGMRFAGSLHGNPYLASIGLESSSLLADRLRTVRGVRYRRMGDLHDFEWDYPDLASWAQATVFGEDN